MQKLTVKREGNVVICLCTFIIANNRRFIVISLFNSARVEYTYTLQRTKGYL